MCPGTLLHFLSSGADDRLDFVTVDQTGYVGVGDLGSWETARRKKINNRMHKQSSRNIHVILLVDGRLIEGPEDLVKESKSSLGPDNKSAQMATRSELKKVQSPHVDELDTGKIAESFDDTSILIVDNKRTTTLTVAAISEFAFAGAKFTRIGDFDDVGIGVKGFEESDGLLRLGERLGFARDDEGDLLDLLNAMATGENEGWESRCGKGRDNGEATLVLVDLDVPFAPCLGRSEHTSSTAHVTEGGLGTIYQYLTTQRENRDAPGQNDGFLHHPHGEYGRRHDQYPKTQH